VTLAYHAARDISGGVRSHRRYSVLTTDGIDGVMRVATVLRQRGYRLREFAADMREGLVLSTVTCTVSATAEEADLCVQRLLRVPTVVAVDPV